MTNELRQESGPGKEDTPANLPPVRTGQEGASAEAVFDQVTALLIELLDEEDLDLEIALATTFAELEIESILVVALVERLQEIYGEDLNLVEWLSNMDLDEIIALSVGSFVEYIVSWHTS